MLDLVVTVLGIFKIASLVYLKTLKFKFNLEMLIALSFLPMVYWVLHKNNYKKNKILILIDENIMSNNENIFFNSFGWQKYYILKCIILIKRNTLF